MDYYEGTTDIILVPVKVEYHVAAGVVYSFVPPTREDVEKAVRSSITARSLEQIKDIVGNTDRLVKNMLCYGVFIESRIEEVHHRLQQIGSKLGLW